MRLSVGLRYLLGCGHGRVSGRRRGGRRAKSPCGRLVSSPAFSLLSLHGRNILSSERSEWTGRSHQCYLLLGLGTCDLVIHGQTLMGSRRFSGCRQFVSGVTRLDAQLSLASLRRQWGWRRRGDSQGSTRGVSRLNRDRWFYGSFVMPFPHAGVQNHDDRQGSQYRCHRAPAENRPGAPTLPCRRLSCFGHRSFRRQSEGGNFAAFSTLDEMTQHLRSLPFRKGLLHKGREQVSVGMLSTLESIRRQGSAGRLRRVRVCLQSCERDFWQSSHKVIGQMGR